MPLAGDPSTRRVPSQLAIDVAAAGLFIAFVALLFLGNQDPGFPYNGIAAIPLSGSLGALFWANLRADRFEHVVPSP